MQPQQIDFWISQLGWIMFLVAMGFSLWMNHDWYRHSKSENAKWYQRCQEQNDIWAKHCSKINHDWSEFAHKIIDENSAYLNKVDQNVARLNSILGFNKSDTIN